MKLSGEPIDPHEHADIIANLWRQYGTVTLGPGQERTGSHWGREAGPATYTFPGGEVVEVTEEDEVVLDEERRRGVATFTRALLIWATQPGLPRFPLEGLRTEIRRTLSQTRAEQHASWLAEANAFHRGDEASVPEPVLQLVKRLQQEWWPAHSTTNRGVRR